MADDHQPADKPVGDNNPVKRAAAEPTRAADSDSSAEMEALAASFLRVRLLFASGDAGTPKFADDVRELITSAITQAQRAGKNGWVDIYEARRLNILLLNSDETLEALVLNLSELMDAQVPEAATLQKAFDELKDPSGTAVQPVAMQNRLRLLLLDVIESIQWNEQKRYLTRRKTNEAAKRLVWVWFLTFAFFLLPYLFALLAISVFHEPDLSRDAWVASVPWMVLAAGLMGALFSRLIFLQSNWTSLSLDQVEDAKQWSSILLRGSVGMCAAVLLFLFVRSGIAGGGLLPKYEEVGFVKLTFHEVEHRSEAGPHADQPNDQTPPRAVAGNSQTPPYEGKNMNLAFLAPTPHFALLLIWSFIAGFSERFVQDILAASEKKLSEGAPKS